jgi:F420-non-reducing hydrogenase iron-sulfur subunit
LDELKDFEPVIVGFFCNWCTATAADLAGTMRLQYPANIRPIRTMCSSSVDPVYIIKALLNGADGVLISGCPPGDCHYISGNYKTRRRMAILTTTLAALGLEEDRVRLVWISAAEGAKFARTMNEFTARIKQLGPNPMKNDWSV